MRKIKIDIKKKLHDITPWEWFVVILVMSLVIFVVKYFGRSNATWVNIRVEPIGRDWTQTSNTGNFKPPFWMSENINIGDTERDPKGHELVKIIEIDNFERGNETSDIYIVAKVRANYNSKMDKYVYKSQPLDIGSPIEFRLNNTIILGQIIDNDFPAEGYEEIHFEVSLVWRDADVWNAKNISIGDTMTNRYSKEVVAKVIEVKLQPSTTSVLKLSGDKVVLKDSNRKYDVHFKVRLKAERLDNRWYFGGHQKVKIGNLMWFYFDKVDVSSAEIKSINEIE